MDLNSPLERHFRLGSFQNQALKRLKLETVGDLLRHFPNRYGNVAEMRSIASLSKGETAAIFGKLSNVEMSRAFYKKIPMATAAVEDTSGKIKAVWFNQPYIAKMFPEEALVRLEGKVSERKGGLYFSNPKIERVTEIPTGVGHSLFGEAGKAHTLYPVYPESRGITSNWLYHALLKVIKSGALKTITDPLPTEILSRYHLPSLKTALIWIHTPRDKRDAESARKRFAFEEVFFIQLQKQRARREYEKNPAFVIEKKPEEMENFISRFPFEATAAQRRAIRAILGDLKSGRAMSRLLEGDVGSGKTAVAATAAYAAVTERPKGQSFGHLQAAYMCPTEILAAQHFDSFAGYFAHLGISVGLLTGSGCRKFPSKVSPHEATDISRAQLLRWVENGEIPIVVGTHALIQKTVRFKHLALVIIDEQHRFGTAQRKTLARKGAVTPHLLTMTATPIPRTLALTIYGDLDLTLLDEMPKGRKKIETRIVLPSEREQVYESIRRELAEGRQCYVICPRIDEPDPAKALALQTKSVKAEAKRLKEKIFPEFEVGILHGKMKDADKEKTMERFKDGEIKILTATSVVEVGVNVPNATIIVIEGAERFGLSQLHQLRGRVIRSNLQAYCFIFAESAGRGTLSRLKALTAAKNGFELAEYDLRLRGAGDLAGAKQWGISDVGMEAMKNLKMVEAARKEAQDLLDRDSDLTNYPAIKERISPGGQIHFE